MTSVPALVVTLAGETVIVKLAGGVPPLLAQVPTPGAMLPLFNRTLTVPSIELATAISALPSPLKSAAVTPKAPFPAGLVLPPGVLRGFGAPVTKSALLWSVSCRPLLRRKSAVVFVRVGAAAVPGD